MGHDLVNIATAQVETQLSKTKNGKQGKAATSKSANINGNSMSSHPGFESGMPPGAPETLEPVAEVQSDHITGIEDPLMLSNLNGANDAMSDSQMIPNMDFSADNSFVSWEMIGLGLEEPMPTQEAIDEL